MGKEYLKADEKDYEELVDFINYVFSHSGGKTDFPSLLPKIYKNKDKIKYHHIIKVDKRIKGVVGAFPLTLSILDEKVNVVGIGSVSAHPYSKGQGYMKELMNKAICEMKNENVDMSVLNGYRQRYEHFGYEPCGQAINFTILDLNINYKLQELIHKEITINLLDENDPNILEEAYKLHCKKNIKIERKKEEFLDILKSWNCSIYSVFKKGEFIGYISSNNGIIEEIVIKDNKDLNFVIASYIKIFNHKEVNVRVPIYEKEKISQFLKICENYSITKNNNFRIFNYEKIVRIMLKLKATYSNLEDGEYNIKIINYGILKIKVHKNQVEVNKVEEKNYKAKENFKNSEEKIYKAKESFHSSGEEIYKGKKVLNSSEEGFYMELNELEAMEFLFYPIKSYFNFNKDTPSFLNSWIPLPLYIENLDCI
ncbi:MAG: GNAT family N-acetyltransferase [Veillonella sp.]|uniref:GNAT family N-acetyltransferase n=1 Tax=Veillonella sp. TaxID=1926307 RepID=UPI00290A4AB1|nr:GNAT family N-acetyltransferase [Veillonella sp.]MDU7928533.1 GNAT family N-acetyltransferase [Veillonella sp.]MDU7954834.1 GNAT family N-acetyltransferase [Clostridium perfringens]MDU7962882.1 GNAT family N-acetyltransferase [Clostridium perfringens]